MLLLSETIALRTTTSGDLDFVLDAEAGEPNRRFIGQWSREQHTAALTDSDIRHLTVLDPAGERAGYVILTGLRDPNLTVCIKRIVIEAKGCGYGTMTLRLVRDWIFTHTDTHRLWLDVKDHNARARHVYEKAGFTLEGTLRECVRTAGGFESLQILSVLRHEYKQV